MNFPKLLSPIRIGSMEVKNRFVVPAMGTNYANQDGSMSQRLIDYHEAKAKGGFGLTIVEVTAVDPVGKGCVNQPGLWSDEQIAGYKKLVDACHKYGAKVAVQIHHPGRQTNALITGAQPVSPSPIPCPKCAEIPRELTTEEAYEFIQKYVDAARRCRDAGADAVEVHAAHGYLIGQFLSPYMNKRVDEFGGNLENRLRFLLLIIQGIKQQVDNAYPIIVRISGEEGVAGGLSINETRTIARRLEDAGVNAIHVSDGVYERFDLIIPPTSTRPGFSAYLAEEVKKSVKIPVITVGRHTDPYIAEDVLQTGKADLVSFGRQSIADSAFPNKVAGNKLEEIAPCIACNQGCIESVLFGKPMTCLVNPFVGKEKTRTIEISAKSKKVMIVGSGPAGLLASWIAAKRGHSVTLCEKSNVLGGQFRIAAIPPGKGDITAAIRYYITMCEKYGVTIKLNVEVTPELVEKEKPDVVILATGGIPLMPKIAGIDNPEFVKAADVLEGKVALGKKVLIVGGGLIGSETADFLGEYGHKITIIEMKSAIAEDVNFINGIGLKARLEKHKVIEITEAVVKQLVNDGVVYQKDGKEETIAGFDNVLLALGSVSYNPLEEKLKNKVTELYVIGDAVKARKAVEATEEASKIAVTI